MTWEDGNGMERGLHEPARLHTRVQQKLDLLNQVLYVLRRTCNLHREENGSVTRPSSIC